MWQRGSRVRPKDRSRIRSPISGTCHDGTTELHRARSRRSLRCLGAHSESDEYSKCGCKDYGSRSQGRVRAHDFLGGGFGRRFETDFVGEAVEISKAIRGPVKVTWSREDDIQHDYYRTASHAHFEAGLDADGWPVVWLNRIACPSLMARFGPLKDNYDRRSVEICDSVPYAIPNILVDYRLTDAGIPIGFWRSVGASQNGFSWKVSSMRLRPPGRTILTN